jgi:hypothetical protein
MPVRRSKLNHYPNDWKSFRQQIRQQIRHRPGNQGELGGVGNGSIGRRRRGGCQRFQSMEVEGAAFEACWLARLELTTVHLDHSPRNNAGGNLRVLCRRWHAAHDRSDDSLDARERLRRLDAAKPSLAETGGAL